MLHCKYLNHSRNRALLDTRNSIMNRNSFLHCYQSLFTISHRKHTLVAVFVFMMLHRCLFSFFSLDVAGFLFAQCICKEQ